MPGIVENEKGKIVISDDVISMIAGYAAVENYGLVDMKSAGDGLMSIIRFISGDNRKKGVKVTSYEDGTFDIDLYVKLMYGLSMNAVAQNIMSNVKYRVEELTGITVSKINIHIEDVWVDNDAD